MLPRLTPLRAAIVLAAALAAAGLLPGASEGLIYLLPALAIAGAVALGPYPGERSLLALAARRARPPRRRRAQPPSRGPAVVRPRVVRGGLLIAFSLAVRPPPA